MADEIRQQLGFDASNTFAVLAQLNDAFAKFSQSLTDAAARMDAFNQAGAKVDDGVKKTSAAMREAARLFEQTRTPQEKYAATIEKLNGLLQQGAINQDTHSRAMKQAGEALSGAQKTAELAREAHASSSRQEHHKRSTPAQPNDSTRCFNKVPSIRTRIPVR